MRVMVVKSNQCEVVLVYSEVHKRAAVFVLTFCVYVLLFPKCRSELNLTCQDGILGFEKLLKMCNIADFVELVYVLRKNEIHFNIV